MRPQSRRPDGSRLTAGIAVLAACTVLAGCTGSGQDPGTGRNDGVGAGADDTSATNGDRAGATALQLVAFDSCADTLAGLKRQAARHVGPYGLNGGGGPGPIPIAALGGRESVADSAPGDARVPAPAEPPGADGGGPASASAAGGVARRAEAEQKHSATNTHEAGVDEPDLVKTDGKRLVTLADGRLRVIDLASRRLTGTLTLPADKPGPATVPRSPAGSGTSSGPAVLDAPGMPAVAASDLLLHGDRALILTSGWTPLRGEAGSTPWHRRAGSRLLLVDLTGAPKLIGTLAVDGQHLDARQVGGVVRVVVRSAPNLPFVYPDGKRTPELALRENRTVVARSTLEAWLPGYELTADGTRRAGSLVDCAQVHHPARYSGTSMLTVLSVDLGRPLAAENAVSIVADGDTVYGTGSSLYVADDQWGGPTTPPVPGRGGLPGAVPGAGPGAHPPEPSWKPRTQVHKFDVSGTGRPRYVASGEVAGRLLNQFSLSEHEGHLRVATTLEATPGWGDPRQADRSESAVSVLTQRDSRLVEVGRVGGLGKGERIYSVRFLGPVGYVVTFRQTDPLYTLDLRDPRRPRAVGELKINGYSAYLHPAEGGKLIGVGQDATADGRRTGTQVSVFDVADPARPRRIAQYRVPAGHSEAEQDHHAFLYWAATGLIVLPITQPWTGTVSSDLSPGSARKGRPLPPQHPALVLRLRDGALTEVGMLGHPAVSTGPSGQPPADWFGGAGVRRAVVAGDTLWTVSADGALASDERTLRRRAWVPFG